MGNGLVRGTLGLRAGSLQLRRVRRLPDRTLVLSAVSSRSGDLPSSLWHAWAYGAYFCCVGGFYARPRRGMARPLVAKGQET